MSGVYGEQLAAFPELMRQFKVFKMTPRIGAGYGDRYDERTIMAYWSNRKMTRTGIEGDLNLPDHQAVLWVMANLYGVKVKIEQNDFVEHEGEIYRIVHRGDFTLEGGFYKLPVQIVKGVTDQQVTNNEIDKVILSDY